jgi:hypothetical protein
MWASSVQRWYSSAFHASLKAADEAMLTSVNGLSVGTWHKNLMNERIY